MQQRVYIQKNMLSVISTNSTQFLQESNGMPLYKSVNVSEPCRVKMRTSKKLSEFGTVFNHMFEKQLNYKNIFIRSVSGVHEGNCYLFPSNGYKFIYNSRYPNIQESLISNLKHMVPYLNKDVEFIQSILQFSFRDNDLEYGIKQNSEIVFYNIREFYAVPVTQFPNYSTLYSYLTQSLH